jgi:hypothetical protein
MQLSDIQAIIYNSGEFTKTVTVNGADIKAIFVPEGVEMKLNNGDVLINSDRLYCVPTDVIGVKENDTVVIEGTTYYVLDRPTINLLNPMPVEITLSKAMSYE